VQAAPFWILASVVERARLRVPLDALTFCQ
jgi:hypothetical protein